METYIAQAYEKLSDAYGEEVLFKLLDWSEISLVIRISNRSVENDKKNFFERVKMANSDQYIKVINILINKIFASREKFVHKRDLLLSFRQPNIYLVVSITV